MQQNTNIECKDCHRKDISLKPFRTGYICRECFEILHYKKFKYYLNGALKRNDQITFYIINDHTLTYEYTIKLLNMFIEEDKQRKVPLYNCEICCIDQNEIKDLPYHLYERYIIFKSKSNKKRKHVWVDGSNMTLKAGRILAAVIEGDVKMVPSIGKYEYYYKDLIVSRPVDFTEKEVLEYLNYSDKIPRSLNETLEMRAQQFVDDLEIEFDQTPNTIISTAQKIEEGSNNFQCRYCLKPYQPFLNDCEKGICRTCNEMKLTDDIITQFPIND
ncbi:hypothetical protein EHI8A_085810 [Entamoeba histolytica HM-1:IMSS-B]|uniref:Uncharacterized protein n=6 Tax=Entamoeba histolytica TaxID=5759 RepID=C4LYA0_ENTH1|nr:hypothetical protein EHI_166980 [Entamoeba histolytica HM-1:IMSS]EMD47245.1 Hypothetical protein EHI5A_047230 [Entamoeba histolytica KU27]EMH78159.1 hypothetical protein EHI8A_085810 [Entamoeba histolytica HM-1:IMSS-B]EMS17528.1 hypothetical protein KM1_081890 [Entamoeba histolytica HM-3:IMSS]ENY65279.1 hypothetical protein EHI7A_040780 [Entamoeba histolytica HM-1:IMSS-A]GAT93785.1 hypothetical protein CL6EHI_166980 [Entamoeba histolytica]|eukprot:XP_654792.1 hypothetical protein EHI_166980 [Entamoeba histolytica HM-1:IMSS]